MSANPGSEKPHLGCARNRKPPRFVLLVVVSNPNIFSKKPKARRFAFDSRSLFVSTGNWNSSAQVQADKDSVAQKPSTVITRQKGRAFYPRLSFTGADCD
ncbi:MAG: hypothetical protein HYR88_01130 [Verrucomicrobia bacterium]|nr:hypothetical protein [Verrucomicrobiota bacterium]MBI3868831.1 hypothetical protein [Verrucomicrobiota bacterium]